MLLTKDIIQYYDQTFNPQCYLDRYPDIRQDRFYSQNPYQHYLDHGRYEGRLPSCDPDFIRYDTAFDPIAYGDRYPDIPQHFGTDYQKYYQHWLQYGMNEGRKPGQVYIVQTSQPSPSQPPTETTGTTTSTGITDVIPSDVTDTTNIDTTVDTSGTGGNKNLLWIGLGVGLLWFANKRGLFKSKRK